MKEKIIFHVDMNSFFASCEQSRNPELKNKPIIVAGDPKFRNGIVLAASYEAKAYGVKTTMLVHQARRLCPNAIMVQSNYADYSAMSKEVMKIFDDYTPSKQQASIDEAYLDMTGSETMFGNYIDAAKNIQDRILCELGLGCSIGISSNKLLAKMGSDMKKPMGITVLFPQDIEEKMWPLPVRELYGVGKVTSAKLDHLGIKTIGDLANADIRFITSICGDNMAHSIIDSANGKGSTDFHRIVKNPSIGKETTFRKDISDIKIIEDELLLLSDKVSFRLRKKDVKARTVTLKIKYNDFKVITRSMTTTNQFTSTTFIYEQALKLFKKSAIKKPVRLLGISLSNFDEKLQLSLFDDNNEIKNSKVDTITDILREKYGYNSIKRASLVEKKKDPKLE